MQVGGPEADRDLHKAHHIVGEDATMTVLDSRSLSLGVRRRSAGVCLGIEGIRCAMTDAKPMAFSHFNPRGRST